MRSVPREAKGELIAKQVHYPMAIGSDRASRNAKVINIIDSGSDLLLCPGVAAISRGSHLKRRGNRSAFLLTAEGHIADVGVPEERTGRRVVGPDLLLV